MAGYSDWVMLNVTTTEPPLEDEPREFTAEDVTDKSVTLVWKPSELGDEVGYELQRGGVTIAEPTTLRFVDTGLTPSTPYEYRIRSKKP